MFNQGLSVAVLQLKPLLLPSQKGVEKSLLYHLGYVDRIIRVVHRIIRLIKFSSRVAEMAKDLKEKHSVTPIRLSDGFGSDYPMEHFLSRND